jgi:hypothetical protein
MVVALVTVGEVAAGVRILGMDPLLHGVREEIGEEEIGEEVGVGDCQGHCTVSFAGLVLDWEHVVVEGWDLEGALVDHMDLVAEVED